MITKEDMLWKLTHELRKMADASDDTMIFYYETEHARYMAGNGDLDKYKEMMSRFLDEAVIMERHKHEAAY